MKNIFLFFLFLLISFFSMAQRNDVHFGIKGGLNIASLNVENGVDFNSRASFYLGGLAHIHVSPHFAVQPELYYSGQGGKDANEQVKLGYINIPVLLQYMAGNGFRLQTGPQLGILISAKDELNNVEADIKNSFKTVGFDWAFGISYQFPGSGFGADARYNLGISNINEGSQAVQNRVVALGLFYQFMNSYVHRR